MAQELLFVPLALFASAAVWAGRNFIKPTSDAVDVDWDFDEGLGLTGTFLLISLVTVLTLYALYQIT